jgi:hypothetical protein
MLIEYLAQPRASDITSPGDISDSYVWTKEVVPAATWHLDEDH